MPALPRGAEPHGHGADAPYTAQEIADTIHNIEVAARVALGGMSRDEADLRNVQPVDAQKFDLEESVHA